MAGKTISRWLLPCYFTEENHRVSPVSFDLTTHIKTILANEVWQRKFKYGFDTGLKNTDISTIAKATVVIYPRFISGAVYFDRLEKLVKGECGKIPKQFNLESYKKWPHANGLAVVSVAYNFSVKMPSRANLKSIMPQYNQKFIEVYHQMLAVSKELSAFFLAGLHLTFPTHSIAISNDNPLNDGIFQIASGRQLNFSQMSSNRFMHEILIETSKINYVERNLEALAGVWHYDLWPLNRYMSAVESDQITMDNLLDLLYALEGLFDKSTASDFIKITCMMQLCKTKREARQLKALLDLAYRIRNDVAHGERSYDNFDRVKLAGKEILAQEVYWKMKNVAAGMIIRAISKMLASPNMRNLRFTPDDFINLAFK